MPTHFIIPQSNTSIIARIENDKIQKIGFIDAPYNSKSVITANNQIVSLCFTQKALRIFNLEGEQINEIRNINYTSIACKNNTIFLGGEATDSKNLYCGEMCSIIDMEGSKVSLKDIEIPIKIVKGKSIDDILIDGNILILVDNVITPKFLLEYDITDPNNPVHKSTILLDEHGTNEHITKGDISNNWAILLSSTIGREASSSHIVVRGKSNGVLSLTNFHDSNSYFYDSFMDICLIDNLLYITRTKGLYYIDLNKRISNRKIKAVKNYSIYQPERLIKTPCNKLIVLHEHRYALQKPPAYNNSFIVRLWEWLILK